MYNLDLVVNDDIYKNDSIIINPQGPVSGTRRIVRGGSWYDSARTCIVGIRNHGDPNGKSIYLGFRLAWRLLLDKR